MVDMLDVTALRTGEDLREDGDVPGPEVTEERRGSSFC